MPGTARPSATVVFTVITWLLATRVHAEANETVAWRPEWRTVGLVEGLSLIPMGGALLAIQFAWKPPQNPRWEGGIFFDNAVRRALRSDSREGQSTAQTLGDWLYLGGTIAPVLIDAGIVALGIHGKPEVALQLLLIDLQSLAIAGLVSLSSEHGVGRARPFVPDCDDDGVVRSARGEVLINRCGSAGANKSFFSGHAASTATAAGLTCLHHQHLPLYGGGAADVAPCAVMIGVSLATGVSRIVSDVHWTSDVLLGWGVGALAGYVLPAAIHYGFSAAHDPSAFRALPVVRFDAGEGELVLVGNF